MSEHIMQGEQQPGMHDHERTDARTKRLWIFLAIVIGSCIIVIIFVRFYWATLAGIQDRPAISPFTGPRDLPPAPRLQVVPAFDWDKYKASEDKVLTTYGWVNKETGAVRIPIDRAMDLLAQRGLPSRTTQQSPKEQPKEQIQQPSIRQRNSNDPMAH